MPTHLFPQGNAQKVRLTYRYAPRRENQIDILQLAKARARGGQVIRQNTGIDHFATQTL
jgi:hypothetical protein